MSVVVTEPTTGRSAEHTRHLGHEGSHDAAHRVSTHANSCNLPVACLSISHTPEPVSQIARVRGN